MSDELLRIADLDKSFGGLKALQSFSCSVQAGEILGLIGPNGAGKTTLFNLITGFLRADGGSIRFRGQPVTALPAHRIASLGIARTFQNLRLVRELTVAENVLLALRDQPGEHLGNVFFRSRQCARHEKSNRAKAAVFLERVGLAEKGHASARELSYGQQKLLSLACCLASGGALLLLDEPVAGVASEMKKRILSIICELPTEEVSVVLIEHDMDVIMGACSRVVFMDAGELVAEGTPKQVRDNPRVIEAYLS